CDLSRSAEPCPCSRLTAPRRARVHCRAVARGPRDAPPDRPWSSPHRGWERRGPARRKGCRWFPVPAERGSVAPRVHPTTRSIRCAQVSTGEGGHPLGQRRVSKVPADTVEGTGRSPPAQRGHVVEKGGIDPEGGDVPKELRQLPLVGQSLGQLGRTAHRLAYRWIPLTHLVGDPIELPVVGQ